MEGGRELGGREGYDGLTLREGGREGRREGGREGASLICICRMERCMINYTS